MHARHGRTAPARTHAHARTHKHNEKKSVFVPWEPYLAVVTLVWFKTTDNPTSPTQEWHDPSWYPLSLRYKLLFALGTISLLSTTTCIVVLLLRQRMYHTFTYRSVLYLFLYGIFASASSALWMAGASHNFLNVYTLHSAPIVWESLSLSQLQLFLCYSYTLLVVHPVGDFLLLPHSSSTLLCGRNMRKRRRDRELCQDYFH